MSEKNKADREDAGGSPLPRESQKERWVKYGGNVVLTIVVVVALSILAIFLGQTWKHRTDTTAGQSHKLSEATDDLVKNLPSDVKLVSLYAHREEEGSKPDANTPGAAVRAQEVADLLEEYKNKSSKISVEEIDPYAEPAKVQQLFDEVSRKYGNNVNLYKDALADFDKTVDQITTLIDKETKALKDVPSSNNRGLEITLSLLRQTLDGFPNDLRDLQSTLPAELKKTNPDYKRAAEAARTKLGELSRNLQGMLDGFKSAQDDLKPKMDELAHIAATQPATTQPSEEKQDLQMMQTFSAYAQQADPRLTKIKKLADDLIGRLRNLGELKQLDELRDKKADSIVVMGAKDMIVIPKSRVWREAAKDARFGATTTQKVRFAGEQEISTAMVVLTSPQRPRVTFVRAGGPPLTVQLENDQISYTGPYFAIAEKLREYNFEVLEKDLTDQWARQEMQMHMQMPDLRIPPEADKEQLAASVWVVLPGQQPNPMSGEPPSPIAAQLSEHLASGGSAMVMFKVQDDGLVSVLAPWGITASTDTLALHAMPPETEGRVTDQVEEFRRGQFVWVLNEFGSHAITTGLEKLDLLMYPVAPIVVTHAKGITTTSLVPLTDGNLQTWGKHLPFRQQRGTPMAFDPKTDMNPPLYGAAAAEKTSGDAKHPASRLVVFGSTFPTGEYVTLRERDVQHGGTDAPRFPANTELFTNSIFWLSHMEKMMSIAPASRDVALIAPISSGAMVFWRTFMLAFVPLVVLLCGARIYFSRRD
jgi:Sec-independent protein translocase protein TatA